jgi:hypothetical protein
MTVEKIRVPADSSLVFETHLLTTRAPASHYFFLLPLRVGFRPQNRVGKFRYTVRSSRYLRQKFKISKKRAIALQRIGNQHLIWPY